MLAKPAAMPPAPQLTPQQAANYMPPFPKSASGTGTIKTSSLPQTVDDMLAMIKRFNPKSGVQQNKVFGRLDGFKPMKVPIVFHCKCQKLQYPGLSDSGANEPQQSASRRYTEPRSSDLHTSARSTLARLWGATMVCLHTTLGALLHGYIVLQLCTTTAAVFMAAVLLQCLATLTRMAITCPLTTGGQTQPRSTWWT